MISLELITSTEREANTIARKLNATIAINDTQMTNSKVETNDRGLDSAGRFVTMKIMRAASAIAFQTLCSAVNRSPVWWVSQELAGQGITARIQHQLTRIGQIDHRKKTKRTRSLPVK